MTPHLAPSPVLPADIVCIGALHWDIIGRTPAAMPPGADLPGRISREPGGVAMNIAAALARLGLRPAILAAVGSDGEGAALIAAAAALGVVTDHVWRAEGRPTDRYIAIEDAGGLVAAIADAGTLEAAGARILAPLSDGLLARDDAPWAGVIVLDGNLGAALLAAIATLPGFAAADLRVASAGSGKATRLRPLLTHPRATLYLNREEAGLICDRPFSDAAGAVAGLLARGAARVLVTDGAAPAAAGTAGRIITARPPAVRVARVTGAGDAFMAAHIVAEIGGAEPAAALDAALAAAALHVSGETAP